MNNLLQKEYRFGFSAQLRTELWLAGGLKLLLITLGAGIIVPFLPTAFCVLYRFGLLVFLMVLPQVASIRAVRSGWNRYLRTLPHPEGRIVNARHLFYAMLLVFYIIWISVLYEATVFVHGDMIAPELDRILLMFGITCACLSTAVMLPFTLAAERFDKGWLTVFAWFPIFFISLSSGMMSVVGLTAASELTYSPALIRNGLLVIVLSQLLSWMISRIICVRHPRRKATQIKTEQKAAA